MIFHPIFQNGINQANLINKGVIYMDKIAVISDIHGNIQALESVLNDIKLRGIERIICLGDLVGKGYLIPVKQLKSFVKNVK